MNANGIIASTGSSAGSTTGGATAGSAKAGTSDGFGNLLVQVLGGAASGNAGGTTTGVPAGMLGIVSLLGAQLEPSAGTDLNQLLAGLTEQLNGLQPDAELPQDLQEQLAALLLVLQQLLAQNGPKLQDTPQATDASSAWAPETATAQTSAAAEQSIGKLVPTLQQMIRQVETLIARGELPKAAAEALAKPLQDAIQTLKASAETPRMAEAVARTRQSTEPIAGSSAQAAAEVSREAAQAAPEIRRLTKPVFHPAWQLQASIDANAKTESMPAALPTLESQAAGDNNAAPAWTFQKPGQTPLIGTAGTQTAAPAQVPVQQFADHIGKFLVKQFVLTQGQGVTEAKISLTPEHLGQVDIKILMQNGQITAQFVTESGAAKDLLENQMASLRTALQGQGLQVDKMEVVQQSTQSSGTSFYQQQQGQQGSGQQGGSGAKHRGAQGGYDEDAFEAELDRNAFLRGIGYGSALNVTA